MRSLKPPVPPDWLREHRRELGMPADPVVHPPLVQPLLKGALLGILLVLAPWALLAVAENQQRRLEAEVLALDPVETRVGDAKARLQTMAKERGALNQQTQKIAAQLVALRSSSALLEQMQQVTPQGVRLLSVVVLPSKLILKGEAEGADAFERINALALNLEAQDELRVGGTFIVKATANDKGFIDFSLESEIDASVRATSERLLQLGSEGLARRYALLQEQGIAL